MPQTSCDLIAVGLVGLGFPSPTLWAESRGQSSVRSWQQKPCRHIEFSCVAPRTPRLSPPPKCACACVGGSICVWFHPTLLLPVAHTSTANTTNSNNIADIANASGIFIVLAQKLPSCTYFWEGVEETQNGNSVHNFAPCCHVTRTPRLLSKCVFACVLLLCLVKCK